MKKTFVMVKHMKLPSVPKPLPAIVIESPAAPLDGFTDVITGVLDCEKLYENELASNEYPFDLINRLTLINMYK